MKNTQNQSQKQVRQKEELEGITLEYASIQKPMWKLFGFSSEDVDNVMSLKQAVPVRVYYYAGTEEVFEHPHVPKINPNHQFEVLEVLLCLLYFVKGEGFPPFFFGLQGTGKTSFFDQLHARLGLPKVEVVLGEDSEVIDLGGQMLPTEEGGMKFSEGLLVQAMRNGWTLQFEEYNLLPKRQQKMLNDAIENRRFTIETTGVKVTAHTNWRVCATANDNNTGTGSNMFVSGGGMDASVNERFWFYEKHYLPKAVEKKILVAQAMPLLKRDMKVSMAKAEDKEKVLAELVRNVCGNMDEDKKPVACIIDQMLLIAEHIRTAHENSKRTMDANAISLDSVMSTRTLIQWCLKTLTLRNLYSGTKTDMNGGKVFETAYKLTFVNGAPYDEHEVLMQIFHDSLGGVSGK